VCVCALVCCVGRIAQFTASNGDPGSSSSLHHIRADHSYRNQYQKVIASIGDILMVRVLRVVVKCRPRLAQLLHIASR
jgi:hypothetical protein